MITFYLYEGKLLFFATICFIFTFYLYSLNKFQSAFLLAFFFIPILTEKMKQIIQSALLPFTIFTVGLILLGCEQAREPQNTEPQSTEQEKTEISVPLSHDTEPNAASEHTQIEAKIIEKSRTALHDLSQGNPLNIVRDVADLQLKAGDYLQQLQNTQNDLQHAINDKNVALLDTSLQDLKMQLTDFNQTLAQLNLKSQEVEHIRQKISQTNTQILASDLFNGAVDLKQVDVKQIEQQMTNIQAEMLKLATLLLPQKAHSTESAE